MGAVVALVELRVDRVLPFQHAGRVRDADEELRARIDLPGAEAAIERGGRLADFLARPGFHGPTDSRIRRAGGGGEDELAAGILLEDVVDHLRHWRVTNGVRVDPFVAPADGRAERRAVGE